MCGDRAVGSAARPPRRRPRQRVTVARARRKGAGQSDGLSRQSSFFKRETRCAASRPNQLVRRNSALMLSPMGSESSHAVVVAVDGRPDRGPALAAVGELARAEVHDVHIAVLEDPVGLEHKPVAVGGP